MTDNRVAASMTVFAMGPTWSRLKETGTTPRTLTRPYVGLMLLTPQKEAGRVMEPPVCVPNAPKHMPVATAAADQLLEPPGVWPTFQGLRVLGGSKHANSVVTDFPKRIAPA